MRERSSLYDKHPIRLDHADPQILRQWDLQVPVDAVLRMQAADPEVVIGRSPALVAAAEKAIVEGVQLVEPVVLFRAFKLQAVVHERLTLERGMAITSKLLVQHCAAADFLVVAVCTVGEMIQRKVEDHFQEDPILGLALDAYGSAAVESLATEFCACVEGTAAQSDKKSTIPLSPGMVNWPVDQGQRQIFEILDPGVIGVRLTQASMMQPQKTISLVVGLGEKIANDGITCDYCSMRDRCHYRDHYIHVEPN